MTENGENGNTTNEQEALDSATEDQFEELPTDAESLMRLRSIDVQLLRILEEMSAGRQDTVAELRADLAAVTRVLREKNQFNVLLTTGLVFGAIILGYYLGLN